MSVDLINGESGSFPGNLLPHKNYNLIDDSNTSSKQEAFEATPDIDGEPDKYELFSWDLEVQ